MPQLSRRTFLRGAAAALAAPYLILPRRTLASTGQKMTGGMNVNLINDPSLGNSKCVLIPFNGEGEMTIWDPVAEMYAPVKIPPGGIVFDADDCYVNGAHRVSEEGNPALPFNLEHFLYAHLDNNGAPYLNARPIFDPTRTTPIGDSFYYTDFVWNLRNLFPKGFPTDRGTNKGTLVGMIWRDPVHNLQGQFNSQYVLSWWNPGSNFPFFNFPVGTGNSAGWTGMTGRVEVLSFARYVPIVTADLNYVGCTPGAGIWGRIAMAGSGNGYSPVTRTQAPGGQAYGHCTLLAPNALDGMKFYTVETYCTSGIVTLEPDGLGQAKSTLNVAAKF